MRILLINIYFCSFVDIYLKYYLLVKKNCLTELSYTLTAPKENCF